MSYTCNLENDIVNSTKIHYIYNVKDPACCAKLWTKIIIAACTRSNLLHNSTLCNSRKYPYLPQGRHFFSKMPPPLWKFQLSFIHFFTFFGLTEPPTPQEIPIPSVEEYGYFLELHNSNKAGYMYFKL